MSTQELSPSDKLRVIQNVINAAFRQGGNTYGGAAKVYTPTDEYSSFNALVRERDRLRDSGVRYGNSNAVTAENLNVPSKQEQTTELPPLNFSDDDVKYVRDNWEKLISTAEGLELSKKILKSRNANSLDELFLPPPVSTTTDTIPSFPPVTKADLDSFNNQNVAISSFDIPNSPDTKPKTSSAATTISNAIKSSQQASKPANVRKEVVNTIVNAVQKPGLSSLFNDVSNGVLFPNTVAIPANTYTSTQKALTPSPFVPNNKVVYFPTDATVLRPDPAYEAVYRYGIKTRVRN